MKRGVESSSSSRVSEEQEAQALTSLVRFYHVLDYIQMKKEEVMFSLSSETFYKVDALQQRRSVR